MPPNSATKASGKHTLRAVYLQCGLTKLTHYNIGYLADFSSPSNSPDLKLNMVMAVEPPTALVFVTAAYEYYFSDEVEWLCDFSLLSLQK